MVRWKWRAERDVPGGACRERRSKFRRDRPGGACREECVVKGGPGGAGREDRPGVRAWREGRVRVRKGLSVGAWPRAAREGG